jgi:hypothetical protein
MSTKLINMNLSSAEYLPVKSLLDEFAAGNLKKESLVVPYLIAVAKIHGIDIPTNKWESTSLVYFKMEAIRRRELKINIVTTLAIPEDEVVLDDLE